MAIPVFVGDDGKPCEFNCEKEWINDSNNLKVLKDRQKSPQSDHFLGTIVKFLGENKIAEVVADKPWKEGIPRDANCNFNIIDLGSSVPIRSIELCRMVKC